MNKLSVGEGIGHNKGDSEKACRVLKGFGPGSGHSPGGLLLWTRSESVSASLTMHHLWGIRQLEFGRDCNKKNIFM